jgi:hypothetical protein
MNHPPKQPSAYESARSRLAKLHQRWRDPALTVLAVLLLVLMFVIAPLQVLGLAPLLLVAFVPVLIAAVIVVSESAMAVITVFLGIGLFAAATVLHFNGSAVFPIYLLLVAGFIVACALFWVVARAVFAPGRVTYHRIAGSLLLYLMIGAIFAGIYGIIGLLVPHAFAGMPPRDDAAAVVAHVLYVSFSTLSTAGGEILASHPITRGLSNLEAIIGQLFPATLIARVVTLQLADRDRQSRFHMLSSNIDGASETQRDVRTD